MFKNLLFLFVALGWSLASHAVGAHQNNKEQIPTVPFCDLTEHPEKYAGQVVRIQASYVSWWESSYLYNLGCDNEKHEIHNGLACSEEKECLELFKRIYGHIEKYQRPDQKTSASRAYVTVIGRLEGPSEVGYGHLNTFKFEFKIMSVESASPMPSKLSK